MMTKAAKYPETNNEDQYAEAYGAGDGKTIFAGVRLK